MIRITNNVLLSGEQCVLELFPHIDIDVWGWEDLRAICRVLFAKRVTKEAPLRVKVASTTDPEDLSGETVYIDYGNLNLKNINNDWVPVTAAAVLKRLDIDVKAYRNEKKRIGIITAPRNFDEDETKYLAAILPQVAPWFFNGSLDKFEMEIIQAIMKNDNTLDVMLHKYVESEGLEKILQSKKFASFFDGLIKDKLSKLTASEESILKQIRDCEDRIRGLLAEYSVVSEKILGAKARYEDSEIEDFKDYLINNPNCYITDAEHGTLTIFVTGFVTNYSEEKYKSISTEMRSVMYAVNCNCSFEVMKSVYDSLFLGDRYKVNCFGGLTMNLNQNYVSLLRNSEHMEAAKNALPNPHIYHYACAGGFTPLYNDAMVRMDYVECLDIAFSEVQNINWSDPSPVSKFANDLFRNYKHTPCIWDSKEKCFISPANLIERVGGKNG